MPDDQTTVRTSERERWLREYWGGTPEDLKLAVQRFASVGERADPETVDYYVRREMADLQELNTLLAAIDYAIEQGLEAADWLKLWRDGDPEAMAELEKWRQHP